MLKPESISAGLLYLALAVSAPCQSLSLQAGASIERHIASGETQAYALDLQAAQIVRAFFAQALPFPVTVKLGAPNGRPLAERTSRQNILFSALAEESGRYTLEVVAAGTPASAAGDYRIGSIEIRGKQPDDDALLKADADYTNYRSAAAASSAKAVAELDAAAALYKRLDQRSFEGWSLLLSGQYQVRLSDSHQASERYWRSAEAFRSDGNRSGRALALDFAGDIAQVLRNPARAVEAATEELAIAREIRHPGLEAGALTILARAYSSLGEKQRAVDLFAQAAAAARAIRDRTREAAALRYSAALHNELGDHEQALALYKSVLPIDRELGQKLQEAATLSNLGNSYASVGQAATAVEYFEQAIRIFRATGGGRAALATTLSNAGRAYVDSHQPGRSIPLFEEALAIARETNNRFSVAYGLLNLARARDAVQDPEGAAKLLAEALPIAKETRELRLEADVHFETARVARTRGDLEMTREHAPEAIRLMELMRDQVAVPDLRSSVIAEAGTYYELQVDALMQLFRRGGPSGLMEQARQTVERQRARNLMDVLLSAGIPRAATRDPDLVTREQSLRSKLGELAAKRNGLKRAKAPAKVLAAMDREIDEAWTGYQSVRSKLMAADPLALAAADTAPGSLDALRKEALDANTLLLEYSLGRPRSYLWVVSHDSESAFDLAPRAEIEEAARSFWDAVKGGLSHPEVERAATRLTELILTPARAMLENKRLLIVADGALQYVPFAALADPAATASYSPLIETHEIVGEPSASALVLVRRGASERKPAARSLAVFADPVFEADDPRVRGSASNSTGAAKPAFLTRAAELRLARLPSTRREAQLIASLVPEPERWLAMDFNASRDAAVSERIARYRMLHFATHGVVDPARPELSALALSLFDSRGRPQDGFLRLYEIYNLKMQADLVVLSACDTALGRNVRGEGLVGLARGFMHAGASRVAASLWKVDDQATSELMRLFYAAMLGPKHKSATAALREAQLTLARQERWHAPYYWAAFTLQGEWK